MDMDVRSLDSQQGVTEVELTSQGHADQYVNDEYDGMEVGWDLIKPPDARRQKQEERCGTNLQRAGQPTHP